MQTRSRNKQHSTLDGYYIYIRIYIHIHLHVHMSAQVSLIVMRTHGDALVIRNDCSIILSISL